MNPVTRSRARGVLVAMMLVQIVATIAMFAPPVLAPAVERDLGVPAVVFSSLTPVAYTGCALVMLVSGFAMARWGLLHATRIALGMCAIGIGLIGTAPLAVLPVAAFVLGMGYATINATTSVILAAIAPADARATWISVKQTGIPIGGACVGALLPALASSAGWRTCAIGMAALCAVAAIATAPVRRIVGEAPRTNAPARFDLFGAVRLLREHRLLGEIALVGTVYTGTQLVIVSFLVVYLTHRAGLDPVAAGRAMAVAMAGGVIGRVVTGVVADRWLAPRSLLAWLGLATFGCLGLLIGVNIAGGPSPLLVYAVCALVGATGVGWNGVFIAEVARVAPAGRVGEGTSAALFLVYCSALVTPPLFLAIVAATGSYDGALISAAATSAVAALLLVRRRG